MERLTTPAKVMLARGVTAATIGSLPLRLSGSNHDFLSGMFWSDKVRLCILWVCELLRKSERNNLQWFVGMSSSSLYELLCTQSCTLDLFFKWIFSLHQLFHGNNLAHCWMAYFYVENSSYRDFLNGSAVNEWEIHNQSCSNSEQSMLSSLEVHSRQLH